MLISALSKKSRKLTLSSWFSKPSCAILNWILKTWKNSSQWWKKSMTPKKRVHWTISRFRLMLLPMEPLIWTPVWLNSVRTILKSSSKRKWKPMRWLPKWIRSILLRTGMVSRNWFHRAISRIRKLSCVYFLCIRIPRNVKRRLRTCLPYSRNWPRRFFLNCVVRVWRWIMKSSVVATSRLWHNSVAMPRS